MKVNILGTEYVVKLEVPYNDKTMMNCDGWTDDTSKVIVVSDCETSNYDNVQNYKNKVLRHEIIHSFLQECGLAKGTCDWHCEEMVEWCATMVPKIMETYENIIKFKKQQTVDVHYIDGHTETHGLSTEQALENMSNNSNEFNQR